MFDLKDTVTLLNIQHRSHKICHYNYKSAQPQELTVFRFQRKYHETVKIILKIKQTDAEKSFFMCFILLQVL